MLSIGKLFDIFGQEDAPALGTGLRFGDDHSVRFVVKMLAQVVILSWESPRLRVKIVLVWKGFLHLVEVPGEVVFAGQVEHRRKVVNLLVWTHLRKSFWGDCVVGPGEIPFRIGLSSYIELQCLRDLLDDWVFAVYYGIDDTCEVDDEGVPVDFLAFGFGPEVG